MKNHILLNKKEKVQEKHAIFQFCFSIILELLP